jgi:hypothetical protein
MEKIPYGLKIKGPWDFSHPWPQPKSIKWNLSARVHRFKVKVINKAKHPFTA